MKIGDKVKLKNIPENDRYHLKPYLEKAGTVINIDNYSPPRYLRVSFGEFYEDMFIWRVVLL